MKDAAPLRAWIDAQLSHNVAQEQSSWDALSPALQDILSPLRAHGNTHSPQIQATESQLTLYLSMLQALPQALCVKDHKGRFVLLNNAAHKLFGPKSERLLGQRIEDADFLSAADRKRLQQEDDTLLSKGGEIKCQRHVTLPDGQQRDVFYSNSAFFIEETGMRGLVGQMFDNSNEKRLERELKSTLHLLAVARQKILHLSHTDPLTGLNSRTVLPERMAEFAQVYAQSGMTFCLVHAAIENLRTINDHFGYERGDEALKQVAELLKQNGRPDDSYIRYGGGTIVILLPMTNRTQARAYTERIARLVRSAGIGVGSARVQLRLGVTEYEEGDTLEQLVNRAAQESMQVL